MSILRNLFSAVKYWHSRFFNIYPVGQGRKSSSGRFQTQKNRCSFYRQWLKSSSGRFHTRQFACKQSVADVQQARHFFSPYLSCPTIKEPVSKF